MRRIGSVALISILGLLASACGDDDGGERAEVAWATSICTAGQQFVDAIPTDIGDLLSDGGLEEARDQVVDAANQLVDDLSAVELPESDQAEAAQAEIDTISETVADVRDSLSGDVDLSDVLSSVPSQLDAIQTSISNLQELDVIGELRSGFEDSEVCQELFDQ